MTDVKAGIHSKRNYAAPHWVSRRWRRLQGHLDLSELDVVWLGLIAEGDTADHPAAYAGDKLVSVAAPPWLNAAVIQEEVRHAAGNSRRWN